MVVCYCSVGLHIECVDLADNGDGTFACCCNKPEFSIEPGDSSEETRSRRLKSDEEVGDVLSTGRKRAAEMYPVSDGMRCEWAYLLLAGGGPLPIVGCAGNLLIAERGGHALHHGPDKNTLNNEVGNVHRICPFCHNRWHTLNDQFYGKRPEAGVPFLPLSGTATPKHDGTTLATPEQVEYSEAWWSKPVKERGPYREA